MTELLDRQPTPAPPTGGRRGPLSQATAALARPATWSPRVRLWLMITVAVLALAAYLLVGLTGNITFALGLRSWRVLTVLVVGTAIAVSTVLFHTVTQNKILTPGIMGFDSLYLFIVTTILFTLGVGGLAGIPDIARFGLNVAVMVVFALLLFRWMFTRHSTDLHLMLMVGIVLGTMLRSAAAFMQRLLAPSDFQVLQDFMFASFGRPDHRMVLVGGAVTVACTGLALSRSRILDVMLLGRAQATSLGVNQRRVTTWVIICVTLMVASSTALVGPILFLGLLVANLGYLVAGTHRHVVVLPVTIALSVAVLAVSQLITERVFEFQTATGIIVEFVGGVAFLVLLLRRKGGIG